LVIYGDGHLSRKDILLNFEPSDPTSQFLLMRLESSGATKPYSIWTETNVDLKTLQADVASWRKPSLAILRGTVLGEADFTAYVSAETPRFANRVGGPDFSSPIPRDHWRRLRMEDQFDALLYLGPPSDITISQLPVALCADRGYMEMRLQRLTLAGLQPQVDRLKQYCATVAQK
jgi:hypothetical protein